MEELKEFIKAYPFIACWMLVCVIGIAATFIWCWYATKQIFPEVAEQDIKDEGGVDYAEI